MFMFFFTEIYVAIEFETESNMVNLQQWSIVLEVKL